MQYWEDELMAPLFKSFIPAAFLDAWTRGQYVIGPRTLDYQYAGLALVLRGFYRYDVEWTVSGNNSVEHRFGGYAVVYIKDNELNVTGFRIYNTTPGERTPLLWKSVFSRFIDNAHGRTELYFPYRTFPETELQGEAEKLGQPSSKKILDDLENQIMDGDEITVRGLPSTLYRSLSQLSDSELLDKIGGPMAEPRLRGLCMLEAPSPNRAPCSAASDAKWDLRLEGKNYGVVVGQPIEGTVVFRRLSERLIEKIELTRSYGSQGC
jgi:hypothetical protein